MKLKWQDSYSIGNKELDNQHKRWIEFYNQLEEAMLEGSGEQLKSTKKEILSQMSDYVAYHFEFEEEFMRSIGFPEVKKHWRLHKNFRNEIYQINRSYQDGTVILTREILDMIRSWLVEHIIDQDMKIKEFLEK